jgi:hypothetical protein
MIAPMALTPTRYNDTETLGFPLRNLSSQFGFVLLIEPYEGNRPVRYLLKLSQSAFDGAHSRAVGSRATGGP